MNAVNPVRKRPSLTPKFRVFTPGVLGDKIEAGNLTDHDARTFGGLTNLAI
jgi:hypothetical protein